MTNNIAEYEVLLLGLETTHKRNINNLSVYGNSELVIRQETNKCQAKHSRLHAYKNKVWDVVNNFFSAFNFIAIPREHNQLADDLAVVVTTFALHIGLKIKFEIKFFYRPSIPDNVKHWKVFEDEQEIKRFIQLIEEYSEQFIDEDKDVDVSQTNVPPFKPKISEHGVIQLNNNHIPRGLIPLEKFFDHNDVVATPALKPPNVEVEAVDISTTSEQMLINLSTSLSQHTKGLLSKYTDVFAWSYNDLKAYDQSIIEHHIPLKE